MVNELMEKQGQDVAIQDLRLDRLKLSNFKGIQSFELVPGGQSLDIYGTNGTGKTSLVDAVSWVLFGRDSMNRGDFYVKTLTEEGTAIPRLDHEVECDMTLNGERLNLKKTFHEVYERKPGSPTEALVRHETIYTVDGKKMQEKSYKARLSGIVDQERFKMLSRPGYFNQSLKWEQRRAIAMEVGGEVSDQEIIDSDPELAGLVEVLKGRTVDKCRGELKEQRSALNAQLKQIPIRIDEVRKGLPEIPGVATEEDVAASLAQRKEHLKEQEEARRELASGGALADKVKALGEIENELVEIAREYRSEVDDSLHAAKAAREEVALEKQRAEHARSLKEREVGANKEEIDRLEVRINALREEYVKTSMSQFDGETTCYACDQPLPADKVVAAEQAFNQERATKLERTKEEGQKCKAQIQDLKNKNTALEEEIAELAKAATRAAEQHEKHEAEIAELLGQAECEDDPVYLSKKQEKERLEAEIEQLRTDTESQVTAKDEMIKGIKVSIDTLERTLAAIRQHKQGEKRIGELEEERQKLNEELAGVEQQICQTDLFLRAKVALLEDRINSKFQIAKFKMFDLQMNGILAECCEVTVDGVPYSGLNTGKEVPVGLDIIRTLQKHWGFKCPIWIDNAESIVDLPEMDCQVFRLYVSKSDKVLRAEVR